jgi:recombination protein RecA
MTTLMTTDINSFLEKLDKKTRDRFKLAREITNDFLPSSSLTANYVMGGGFPRAALTTVYGNYSAGKSGLLLESVGTMQKAGAVCAWVDVENSFRADWAAKLGVDIDSLIVIRQRGAGAIADGVAPLIKAGIDFLVIDSISSIMPEAYLDEGDLKEFDKRKQIGANARATGELLKGMLFDNERTAIAIVSQQRATDAGGGHMAMKPTGGQAVLFGSSIILKLTSSGTENNQKMGSIFIGDKIHQLPVAREVKLYGEKNKVGPQSRTGTYTFYYDGEFVGIDHVDELVNMGKLFGVVKASGAWTYYGDDQWQGQSKFVDSLKEDSELYSKLEKELNMMMTGEVNE